MVVLGDFIIATIYGLIGLIFSVQIAITAFCFALGYCIIRRPMLEKPFIVKDSSTKHKGIKAPSNTK